MSFLTGGGSGSIPQPPPFHPIQIGGKTGIANKALEQDINRYFDFHFPVYPGMQAVRQKEIEDAYQQLTGPLSPEFQSTFMRNAGVTQQGVTGGGDPFSGMGIQKGSFAEGNISSSVARQTMAKQDYDRARMESLVQQNPIPGLGLSQSDLLSLYVYNTGAQNSFAMQQYANNIAGANAAFANQQNTYNSIGNLISGLGNIYSNYNLSGGGIPDWSNSEFNFNSLGL